MLFRRFATFPQGRTRHPLSKHRKLRGTLEAPSPPEAFQALKLDMAVLRAQSLWSLAAGSEASALEVCGGRSPPGRKNCPLALRPTAPIEDRDQGQPAGEVEAGPRQREGRGGDAGGSGTARAEVAARLAAIVEEAPQRHFQAGHVA